MFGACKTTMRAVFSDTALELYFVSIDQTEQGRRTAFRCEDVYKSVKWPIVMKRIL